MEKANQPVKPIKHPAGAPKRELKGKALEISKFLAARHLVNYTAPPAMAKAKAKKRPHPTEHAHFQDNIQIRQASVDEARENAAENAAENESANTTTAEPEAETAATDTIKNMTKLENLKPPYTEPEQILSDDSDQNFPSVVDDPKDQVEGYNAHGDRKCTAADSTYVPMPEDKKFMDSPQACGKLCNETESCIAFEFGVLDKEAAGKCTLLSEICGLEDREKNVMFNLYTDTESVRGYNKVVNEGCVNMKSIKLAGSFTISPQTDIGLCADACDDDASCAGFVFRQHTAGGNDCDLYSNKSACEVKKISGTASRVVKYVRKLKHGQTATTACDDKADVMLDLAVARDAVDQFGTCSHALMYFKSLEPPKSCSAKLVELGQPDKSLSYYCCKTCQETCVDHDAVMADIMKSAHYEHLTTCSTAVPKLSSLEMSCDSKLDEHGFQNLDVRDICCESCEDPNLVWTTPAKGAKDEEENEYGQFVNRDGEDEEGDQYGLVDPDGDGMTPEQMMAEKAAKQTTELGAHVEYVNRVNAKAHILHNKTSALPDNQPRVKVGERYLNFSELVEFKDGYNQGFPGGYTSGFLLAQEEDANTTYNYKERVVPDFFAPENLEFDFVRKQRNRPIVTNTNADGFARPPKLEVNRFDDVQRDETAAKKVEPTAAEIAQSQGGPNEIEIQKSEEEQAQQRHLNQ